MNNLQNNQSPTLKGELCGKETPNIVCAENRSRFCLQKGIILFEKIKIDSKKETTEKRCDYLLKKKKQTKNVEIFVELKGGHHEEGIQQLINSFESYASKNDTTHYAVLVASRGISKTKSPSLKQMILQVFKTTLITGTKNLTVEYNPKTQKLKKIN